MYKISVVYLFAIEPYILYGVKVQTKICNHKMILYFLCERLYERTKTDHMHGIEEANLLPLAQKQNQLLVRTNC